MTIESLIIDLKVNECSDNFNITLHEEILFKLFQLGLTLDEIGRLKGVI